jgi:hypothetical protein
MPERGTLVREGRLGSPVGARGTPVARARLVAGIAIAAAAALAGCAGSEKRPAPAPPADPLAPLAWLVGAWSDAEPQTSAMEEHWTAPLGGTMFGVNRTVRDGHTIAFEYLRIEARDGGKIVYVAQPGGRSPGTDFPLVDLVGTRAVFANPAHDFPKRLIYSLEAGILTVVVEGVRGGETSGFTLRWKRTG